jgi:hypothetical protein
MEAPTKNSIERTILRVLCYLFLAADLVVMFVNSQQPASRQESFGTGIIAAVLLAGLAVSSR